MNVSVENWHAARNAPDVPNFIMLARQYPELKATVMRWLDMNLHSDPEAERLLNEIARYMQRRR